MHNNYVILSLIFRNFKNIFKKVLAFLILGVIIKTTQEERIIQKERKKKGKKV